MKEKLFLILTVCLVSCGGLAQSNNVSTESEKKTVKSKSAQQPAIKNEVFEESANEISVSEAQSSILNQASLNIEKILGEVRQRNESKNPTSKQQQKLNIELAKIESVNKYSFEYYLYNYRISNYDFSKFDDLKAAEQLRPNHPQVIKEMTAYHYINAHEKEFREYLNKLKMGGYYSFVLNDFAGDMLKSLPQNAVLITHGEEDTYPILIQQYLNNIRKDVSVVSLNYLQSEVYRNKLRDNGISIPSGDYIDHEFFHSLLIKNKGKEFIASSSIPSVYFDKIRSDIGVNGLGFQLKKELSSSERRKMIDKFENDIKIGLEKKINSGQYRTVLSNYLPMLFEIRNYWIDENNANERMYIEKLILDIGRQTNKTELVKKLLK
ncbi:MAG: hypothetical protein R3277_11625 [Brumimicrobium sp.]|nr:hypothetical protein [Brumimicrobium sp.]